MALLLATAVVLPAAAPGCYISGLPVFYVDATQVILSGLEIIRQVAVLDEIDDRDDDFCEHHYCGPVVVDYWWW